MTASRAAEVVVNSSPPRPCAGDPDREQGGEHALQGVRRGVSREEQTAPDA